jgi:hypothetical protein
MVDRLITAELYKEGLVSLPKKGSFVDASNDDINWQKLYFVQLDTDDKMPFVCVDMKKDVHFPATKGNRFSRMRITEYDVDDLVLFEESPTKKKFITRDQMYETQMDKNTRNSYWQRTPHASGVGAEYLWCNRLRDIVFITTDYAEKAVKILNGLVY